MTAPPQVADVEAILRRALGTIARGVVLEGQLAPEDRGQARATVLRGLRELAEGMRDWVEEWHRSGPLVTASEADELHRMFEVAP
jgi:hypothetical protein